MQYTIIGCGQMGKALCSKFAKRAQVVLYDRHLEKSQKVAAEHGARAVSLLEEAVSQADIVLLAVKPKNLAEVAEQLQFLLKKETLFVSVLAGVSIKTLQEYFPGQQMIRTMPNLAVSCGKGIVGLVETPELSSSIRQKVESLFADVGMLIWVPESKIDPFMALCASAPAYVFYLVEAMIEGGIFLGFPADQAREIVLQVFDGALELLKQTGEHPAAMKWQVASPGGTTIEGLKVLEQERVHYAMMEALQAAARKASHLI